MKFMTILTGFLKDFLKERGGCVFVQFIRKHAIGVDPDEYPQMHGKAYYFYYENEY